MNRQANDVVTSPDGDPISSYSVYPICIAFDDKGRMINQDGEVFELTTIGQHARPFSLYSGECE